MGDPLAFALAEQGLAADLEPLDPEVVVPHAALPERSHLGPGDPCVREVGARGAAPLGDGEEAWPERLLSLSAWRRGPREGEHEVGA